MSKDTLRDLHQREYYQKMLPYCRSEREKELIQACIDHGSPDNAAPYVNLHGRTVRKHVAKIKARMDAPTEMVGNLTQPTKAPLTVKKISAYGDFETGEVKHGWVKYDVDEERRLETILQAAQDAIGNYKPFKGNKVTKTKKYNSKLVACYPFGDPHLGLYAWAEEAGEDFDCDIAERNLRQAMFELVDKAPPAETAIILNLGDFFHTDNSGNATTKGTPVDVDGRWARVVEIGVTLMIDCINMALKKHKKVIVKNNIGNHDQHTSQVLSICLKHAFSNEPRVEIANPADKYFMFKFGKCMIFSTHGDGLKPKKCHGFIANAWAELWGSTEYRFALFGHFHHEETLEEHGLLIRIFNTLASSDAWHHHSGYRSNRNQKCLVFHRDEGLIAEYTHSLSRAILQSYSA